MDIKEKKIRSDINIRFSIPFEEMRILRDRRLFIKVPQESFKDILDHVVDYLGFAHLIAITGMDEVSNFSAVYHLARKDGIIISIKMNIPKEKPVIDTIIKKFPGAEIYEREIEDLLGIKVSGLPEGQRYPLPDDWPKDQHPLRKDWRKNA